MFAGLPGIGVGTLFYVLMAFWMPLREIPRVLRGTSSLAAWKLIAEQMFYAIGIVVTVMVAEKVMLWALGDSRIKPLSPATWIHQELGARATDSILAAPIAASLLLLGGVLLTVEALRVIYARLAIEPVDPVTIGDADRRCSPVEQPLEIG
jgi:hypothetical protein